ncbi:MAG: hypothetical protein IPM07_31010 [Anaerolineales bacterium]|nr:hypothetical protein [Anaerolineales bacterium]
MNTDKSTTSRYELKHFGDEPRILVRRAGRDGAHPRAVTRLPRAYIDAAEEVIGATQSDNLPVDA